jgi:hypothetical protein
MASKQQKIQKLFNDKEKIVKGYQKIHPNTVIGGANVISVTNGLKVNIVDPDDETLTTLSYKEALYYLEQGKE